MEKLQRYLKALEKKPLLLAGMFVFVKHIRLNMMLMVKNYFQTESTDTTLVTFTHCQISTAI